MCFAVEQQMRGYDVVGWCLGDQGCMFGGRKLDRGRARLDVSFSCSRVVLSSTPHFHLHLEQTRYSGIRLLPHRRYRSMYLLYKQGTPRYLAQAHPPDP
jgi:hypothetical protein